MIMRTTLRKKFFILVLVLLTAITFFSLKSETQAAPAWYTCWVNGGGPGGGGAFICLTDGSGAFTTRWMTCRYDQMNQQLAVALTAISTGKAVMAYLDNSLATPVIQYIYLLN